jgi:alginate O-acetyltransferase complex protein AlgJ
LTRFYDELRGNGIEVVDLAPIFSEHRDSDHGPVFCKTDTHWSGNGCVLAAHAMAEKMKIAPTSRHEYAASWKQIEFAGDLVTLLPHGAPKPGPEKTFVRVIADKSTGSSVKPDPDSPVLLMGDSHTLVYHDFLTQGAGLVDQLASELGFVPDLIGTRGSGATAVRVDLYRRGRKDPAYLEKKKVIIWCFSAREFTEADAWAHIPVSK